MQTETNYTIIKVAGEFVTLLNRLLKTITYNVLVFALGLALGYVIVATKVHYYATTHDDYQYIGKLEQTVKDLEQLDKSYT